jgi:hypothetical protein
LNEYYRGGSYVSSVTGATSIPTSGAISLDNFRGTTAYTLSYLQLGDTTSGLIYGAHSTSGGNASGSLNNYAGVAYTSYGAPYTTQIGQSGGFWTSNGSTKIAQVTTGTLQNNWFPLIPTLYGANGAGSTNIGGRSLYALGTCDISPSAASDITFCWRHPNSAWTDSMIQNFLGFNSSHLSQVKRSTQVWWNYMLTGMDDQTLGGFMIFNSSTYNSSGAQSCYNGATKMYLHRVTDTGGEWQLQGWQFAPTVTGTTVTNTGSATFYTYSSYGAITGSYQAVAARTWLGATGRSADYDLGINEELQSNLRSDYTWNLSTTDLVVPMMKSNNGFSGGAFNGARNPLVARFGYIAAT